MTMKLLRLGRVSWVLLVASLRFPIFGVEQHGPLHVLTSFLPVYCFTANVAGSFATVENLIPGTVEPHDYQLSPGDFRKIARADLLIINGLGLEAWIEKAFRGLDKAPKIVEITSGLDRELIKDSGGGMVNPHIWLDPELGQQCVRNILTALQKADPSHAEEFARNAAQYQERLKALAADLDRALAPVRSNSFVTYHNAFPYFVRRFELHLSGIVEETPEVTPSPRYLATLLKKMRQDQVRVLFGERQSPERLAIQITRDLKIRFGELDTLETGALTPGSYEQGMRHNLEILLAGLR